MEYPVGSQVMIGAQSFEVIKDTRLRGGLVLRAGDVYARLGPRAAVLEEQLHTVALHERGFPVPEVLESGDLPDDQRYFTESSVGDLPFHKKFMAEYRADGEISDKTFAAYLAIIGTYMHAQVRPANRTQVSPADFIEAVIPQNEVLPSYSYFGHDPEDYFRALQLAAERLAEAPMGILQFDLNPYNILEKGVIDFELAGYGPIGYDALLSARWAFTWFTDYPSRYPVGYWLSDEQVAASDELVSGIAVEQGLPDPRQYLQEFLLIKSAWAVSDTNPPQPDWPADKLAFRKFRTNLLQHTVQNYLAGIALNPREFSRVPGGEV